METDAHLWSYLSQFLSEWEMFRTKVVEKIKKKTYYLLIYLLTYLLHGAESFLRS